MKENTKKYESMTEEEAMNAAEDLLKMFDEIDCYCFERDQHIVETFEID